MASTSCNQTPSSSASPPTLWDVFLSFRGIDTRYTFTDHLYKAFHRTGIRTFMDNPELRSGEVISDSLIQAIQESKTYIIVLSENYASSSWCLDELVEILSCYNRMKRLVVPVFYNIDPSIVRHQLGSFTEAFDKHRTRFAMEKVDKWRLTLNEVSDFSGYHISKNRSQSDIIDEVVDRISLEINPKTLYVAKYPVGLDSRVKDITALLNSNKEGIIRIGIHGMGGVGKTTLAKALYNQNFQRFQGSCFLANVREVSGTENGLVGLQHQLIVDVLKCNNFNIGNKDQGIELIRARLHSTKVLLVVDDLDNLKPLEYLEGSFALGSLIVITTRNEDLLDRIKVKAKYKVNQMDKDESRQLFTQHAFREDNISHIFTELSNEILENAGGLPLALQVFGSTLLDESEDGWRWFIDKLKRAPIDDVEENLMISFDALKSIDPNLQDIFLDIACFYIGWKKDEVAKILETCYTFVNCKVDILQKRCLITISDEDKFGMHDLLRDMGRKIARNNSPDEPGKHSRLWAWKDIDTVLKNREGTEAIQGLFSGCSYNYEVRMNTPRSRLTFVAKSFKRMSKLKFLYLNNVNLTGSFKQTFKDLRWLCWKFFPLECFPSDFYAEKLVILELPQSNMITWEPPREFKKLKSLNMSGSRKLETTPDFTRFPCLETLNLEDCSSLKEVHVSIGSLESLVHLNLGNCEKLRSLPDSICSLRALEVLTITGCTMLRMLPDISQLSNIKDLNLSHCHHLLSTSGLPTSLQQIKAIDCRSFKKIPNISNLKHLKQLDLQDCRCLTEIEGFEELTSLMDLDLRRCSSMERLPNLSNLKHLKRLNLKYCASLTEVIGLEELTSLEDFKFSYCGNLLSVSNPPNQKRVEAQGCTSLKRLPNLSNLKQLGRLDLTDCEALKEIQGLEEVTSLEHLSLLNCRSMERLPNLSNLKQLGRLDLTDCEALKEIQGLEEVTSLEHLSLWNCRSMERLPDLSSLKHLKSLDLAKCAALKEIQGLEELTSLVNLVFRCCGNLLSVSKFPPNLDMVDAEGCISLKRLPNLSNLKQLERLDLTNCEALKEIQSLEEVTSLEYLTLSNCRSLERLPNLCNLKHLKWLDLTDCESLTGIIGLEELTSLEDLKFGYCGNLLSVSEVPPNLYWVDAEGCTSLKRLPNLSNLKQLERLDLTNCEALKEIQSLEEVTSLEYLTLSNCRSLERLPNLCNLKHLKWLDLTDCDSLTEIIGLEELTSLEDLKFGYCGNLLSVSKIPPNQKWVYAEGCTSLKRLPNLSNLKQLERLDLTNCSGLTEIQGLEELTCLRELLLAGCNSSFLACTLTKRFFEILSGCRHKVEISTGRKEFRDWITTLPSEFGFVRYCLDLGIQLELGSNTSHNYMGIILAFEDAYHGLEYWVENITSGFSWSDTLSNVTDYESLIVIVPSPILAVRSGDKIELKSDQKVIYDLYKTENAMMSEYCNPLHSDLESNKKWLSLGSISTTVNVGEKRSNPSDNDSESSENWLSPSSSSTTTNVEEKRSHPFKRFRQFRT